MSSIKDVAAHAGVSLTTITRVINEKGDVAQETRRRVRRSMEDLGYIPNHMAKALKNNKTGVIGNVTPLAVDNFVFSQISLSLREAAFEFGYQILPLYSDLDERQEERLLHELIGRMAEGIIFTSTVQSGASVIREVLGKGIPIIMLERATDIAGVDKVSWDNDAGSAIAAAHFLERGHRELSFIGKQFGAERDEQERFSGFTRTLERGGVRLDEKRFVSYPTIRLNTAT
jgi:DNA-binding LacI/PurR family transcriptional regulator